MEVSYRSPYGDDDDDDLTEDEEYSDDDEVVRGRSDRGGGGGDGEFREHQFGGGDEEDDFRIDDEDDGEFAESNGRGRERLGQDQVDGESPFLCHNDMTFVLQLANCSHCFSDASNFQITKNGIRVSL